MSISHGLLSFQRESFVDYNVYYKVFISNGSKSEAKVQIDNDNR